MDYWNGFFFAISIFIFIITITINLYYFFWIVSFFVPLVFCYNMGSLTLALHPLASVKVCHKL